ncbi:MAG: AzlD domain-containing protein [Spirochaetaceae bacterium]|jgi:branched-subunit amino acid transport protein AzlD|nr:AzlD domain-containing protein [Spirochaetaceae bacterium]
MISVGAAFGYTIALALVVFVCRALPFVIFKKPRDDAETPAGGILEKCVAFVEKTAPPVAITALAFNTLALEIAAAPRTAALPVLAASALTALLHLWKRNALASIAAGTALYMVISRAA